MAAAERNGHRYVVTLLKADVRPFRPWEQAAKLLDYAFALPAGASIGNMPGDAAKTPSSDVALASPPAPAEAAPAADSGSNNHDLRVALMVGGVVLVVVLLLAARRMSRRR